MASLSQRNMTLNSSTERFKMRCIAVSMMMIVTAGLICMATKKMEEKFFKIATLAPCVCVCRCSPT